MPECEKGSEEHTSELQSRLHLVCRLLLEKNKKLTSAVGGLLPVPAAPSPLARPPLRRTSERSAAEARRRGPEPRATAGVVLFFLLFRRPRRSTLFPYPTLSRS